PEPQDRHPSSTKLGASSGALRFMEARGDLMDERERLEAVLPEFPVTGREPRGGMARVWWPSRPTAASAVRAAAPRQRSISPHTPRTGGGHSWRPDCSPAHRPGLLLRKGPRVPGVQVGAAGFAVRAAGPAAPVVGGHARLLVGGLPADVALDVGQVAGPGQRS